MKRTIQLICFFIIFSARAEAQDIFEAIAAGNTNFIIEIARKNPDMIKSRDPNNRTPLHLAVTRNNSELIEYFIEKGADTEAKDAGEHTPLHLAAINNLSEAATVLINHGAKLETRDNYGRTALILCARERGQAVTGRVLIDAGAEVNATDKFGDNSLSLATWRGKKEFIDLLLESGADVPDSGPRWQMMVYEAASNGLSSLFLKLGEKTNNLIPANENLDNLLHQASAGGSPEVVKMLIDRGFNPSRSDWFGWTPLHYAARDGKDFALTILLEKGVDINLRTVMGQSAYDIALERKMEKTAAILAERGADVSGIKFPVLEGDYLGQQPPEGEASTFAPGIISSVWGLHSTAVFSPGKDEVYWAPMITYPGEIYSRGGLMMMKRVDNLWTPPQWASFSGPEYNDDVPFLSSDGRRIYFISTRPFPGTNESQDENIWYADRTGSEWSDPRPIDSTVNEHNMHWSFSVDNGRNLYFAGQGPDGLGGDDIYVAYYRNGRYEKPVNLGEIINSAGSETTPFIAPDGSFLIYSKQYDLWISYRNSDGRWTDPQKIGSEVNSEGVELCPYITADGKYLFFLSTRNGESHAFWVKSDYIRKTEKTNNSNEENQSET